MSSESESNESSTSGNNENGASNNIEDNATGYHLLNCSGSIASIDNLNNTVVIETSNFIETAIERGRDSPELIVFALDNQEKDFRDWFFTTAVIGDNVTVYYHQGVKRDEPILAVTILVEGYESITKELSN